MDAPEVTDHKELNRLEDLATEKLGHGAAISLDYDSHTFCWTITAWYADGIRKVFTPPLQKKIVAIRELVRMLRHGAIDENTP